VGSNPTLSARELPPIYHQSIKDGEVSPLTPPSSFNLEQTLAPPFLRSYMRRGFPARLFNSTPFLYNSVMIKILVATKNKGKLKEIKEIFRDIPIELLNIPEDDKDNVIEDGTSYYENALKKAKHYGDKYKLITLADDSGLEIEALNGAPGIYSSRFLGESTSFDMKIKKILSLLKGKENRKARFKTISVLYLPEENKIFKTKGIINGEILEDVEKKKNSGFGYDPIFKPEGFNKSFSMLGEKIKNQISHRSKALKKMKGIILKELLGGKSMIEIKINGKRLIANKYIYEVFKTVIFALLGTLKNMPEIKTVEIKITDKET
jgi:XTP/dITP diphosphohydrolase